MARTRSKKKTGSVSVNFKGVDLGGRKRIPEGDYLLRCTGAEEGDSKSSGDPMITWNFVVEDGKHKGAKFWLHTSLVPDALWKLGNLLTAFGHEVPDDELDLDLDDFVDETIMGVIADDSYDGKKVSKIVDFYGADDGGEEEEEEEDEKPSRSRRGKAKDEDEEEDEKPRRKPRKAKDEEEDEDEKPARGKKKAGKFKPIASSDVQEMDEDELADVVEKSGVDVDLDDYKTLRKMRAAVIDALEGADLISDAEEEEEEEEDERPSRSSRRGKKDEDEDDDSPAAKRRARREARKAKRG